MEFVPDPQDAHIQTTASNIHKSLLPYLKSPGHGRFVQDLIEDELVRHETDIVRDPHAIAAICAVAILGLITGFVVGSL